MPRLYLLDMDGKEIEGTKLRTFSTGEYEVRDPAPGQVTYPQDFDGIRLSVYGYFGYWYEKSRRYGGGVSVTLYDKYGNAGRFHIADDMPAKYTDFKT